MELPPEPKQRIQHRAQCASELRSEKAGTLTSSGPNTPVDQSPSRTLGAVPLLICVALLIYICGIAYGNLNHSSKTESRTAKGPTLKTLLVEEPDGVLGIKFYSFEATVRLMYKLEDCEVNGAYKTCEFESFFAGIPYVGSFKFVHGTMFDAGIEFSRNKWGELQTILIERYGRPPATMTPEFSLRIGQRSRSSYTHLMDLGMRKLMCMCSSEKSLTLRLVTRRSRKRRLR